MSKSEKSTKDPAKAELLDKVKHTIGKNPPVEEGAFTVVKEKWKHCAF